VGGAWFPRSVGRSRTPGFSRPPWQCLRGVLPGLAWRRPVRLHSRIRVPDELYVGDSRVPSLWTEGIFFGDVSSRPAWASNFYEVGAQRAGVRGVALGAS